MCDLSDLEIEARIQLSIDDAAYRIEYLCADVLLPAPSGIYVINRAEPVMVVNGTYFTITEVGGVIGHNAVRDITNCSSAIYTYEYGKPKVVIPNLFMQKKTKYINTEPFLPYRGMLIVKQLIEEQINGFVTYRTSNKTPVDILSKFVKEMDINELIELARQVDIIYEDIRQELVLFMGLRKNHLYFVKITDTAIVVKQSIDWRAYQYLLLLEEKKMDNSVTEIEQFGLEKWSGPTRY